MKWTFKFTDNTSVEFEGIDFEEVEEKACAYADKHGIDFDLE